MSSHHTPPHDFATDTTAPRPAHPRHSHGGPASARPQSSKTTMKHLIGYPATALALTLGAAGCGADTGTSPAATVPPITITQSVTPPPIAQTVTQTVRKTVTSTPSEPAITSAAAAPKAAGKITVPDGVGMNYQEAQDTWRASGLHVAPANDATGAHRLPVLDSHWIVLSQDLEPGSKVAADSFITATIKKKTDN